MAENSLEMRRADFEKKVMEEKQTALIEFWAPWCSHCRRIAPLFQQMAEEKSDKLLFGQINVDEERDLARQYGMTVIPTLLLFQGGQVQGSITAPGSIAQIEDFIRQFV